VLLLAILLLVNAAFNVLVWPTFYKRIANDDRARDVDGKATRFFIVHIVLIGAALLLAAVSAVAAIVCLIRM